MISDASEKVGEIELRIEAIELGGFDQRVHGGGAVTASIRTSKQIVLPADRKHPVILPMSGRRWRSIIAGTRSTGAAFVANMSSDAPVARSFTLR